MNRGTGGLNPPPQPPVNSNPGRRQNKFHDQSVVGVEVRIFRKTRSEGEGRLKMGMV